MIIIEIYPWKTAIKRNKLSKPVQIYKQYLHGKILDYGCGHGEDIVLLQQEGYDVIGYDKHYTDTTHLIENTYDVVVCNYVLNVIPYLDERLVVLHDIMDLLKDGGIGYITVRPKTEEHTLKHKKPFNDGLVTSTHTFQKFYTVEDLIGEVSQVFDKVEIVSRNPVIVKVRKV